MIEIIVVSAFFAIVWWAYAPSRKSSWERKGTLPDE
jgi:cbb3-type cytochrome oxidase subunit 3